MNSTFKSKLEIAFDNMNDTVCNGYVTDALDYYLQNVYSPNENYEFNHDTELWRLNNGAEDDIYKYQIMKRLRSDFYAELDVYLSESPTQERVNACNSLKRSLQCECYCNSIIMLLRWDKYY